MQNTSIGEIAGILPSWEAHGCWILDGRLQRVALESIEDFVVREKDPLAALETLADIEDLTARTGVRWRGSLARVDSRSDPRPSWDSGGVVNKELPANLRLNHNAGNAPASTGEPDAIR